MRIFLCAAFLALSTQTACERDISPDGTAGLSASGGRSALTMMSTAAPSIPSVNTTQANVTASASVYPYLAPLAVMLPSLNATPELIVNLTAGAAYAPYVTEKWLYFTGATAGGSGVLRTKKEPEAAVEVVSTEFITNQANFYTEDGMVYFLADKVLMRWPEDNPALLERFELPMAHYRFKGDGDHFFAITYSSQDVTLFDKQTLEPHTIHLEDLTTGGGGAFDVASDGNKLYCTRLDVPGHLYVVDKATEVVTKTDMRIEGQDSSPFGIGYFYVEDGHLYGNNYWGGYFVSINASDGKVATLSVPAESRSLMAEKQRGTDFMYFLAQFPDNVFRFDTKQFTTQTLLPDGYPIHLAYGLTTDASHVYFLTDVTYHDALNGILRVRKQ